MAKTGRKSAYETVIEPRLEDIKKWRKNGATVEQICQVLDISETTFYKYLNEKTEFAKAFRETATFELIQDLKGELVRLSFKHKLETKKQYIRKDLESGHETQYTEIITKEVDGDRVAINLLLQNLDKDNWSNDPAHVELRRQELELRKAIANDNSFNGLEV